MCKHFVHCWDCDCILDYYAQPGIHDESKCWRHCRIGARSIEYAHHTCFCYLCKEDFKKFTPSFLERFLTAGRCNSLHDFQKGNIEMVPGLNYTYYYCNKPVQTLYSYWDSIGLWKLYYTKLHRGIIVILWLICNLCVLDGHT